MQNWFIHWRKLLIVCLTIVLLVGCNKMALEPSPLTHDSENGLKVALLVEGTIYDQGWDSRAYEGLRQVERLYDAHISYVEHVTVDNMEEITREFSEAGYDLIFGHGMFFQDTFNALGKEYPDVSFVFFNGEPVGNNVSAISFVPESMGFFAGMTAALMTETGIVGIIPAYAFQKEVNGFINGAQYINPDITVLMEEVGSWGDRDKGREIAESMLEQQADILYGVGDGFNIEVIDAARKYNSFAIGFITDQSFISRETILVSFLQNVEDFYVDIAHKVWNDEQLVSHFICDFTNGGQAVTPFGTMVPTEKQEIVKKAIEEYKQGKLNILS